VVTTPEFRNAHTSRSGFAHFVEVSEAPQKMDANDRVWQIEAVMSQDVVKDKTISEVARATPVRFLIIVNANDRMVNPQPALEWAAASNAPSYISEKPCGHLIMTCDAETISPMVQKFLAGESLHSTQCLGGRRRSRHPSWTTLFFFFTVLAEMHTHCWRRSSLRCSSDPVSPWISRSIS
jgi:hypothetical protein